jgi:hypothetical protein
VADFSQPLSTFPAHQFFFKIPRFFRAGFENVEKHFNTVFSVLLFIHRFSSFSRHYLTML